jgi:hypothetical protein
VTDRQRLPNRRRSETFPVEAGGLHYLCTVSFYPDGRIGELFLNNTKSNSASDCNARDSAVVASIAIQHGVPIDVIRRALMRDTRGQATGPLGAALDRLAGSCE